MGLRSYRCASTAGIVPCAQNTCCVTPACDVGRDSFLADTPRACKRATTWWVLVGGPSVVAGRARGGKGGKGEKASPIYGN